MSGRRLTAAAASEHPDAATAVGEVIGELQQQLTGSPEFALVLVSTPRKAQAALIATAVHALLGPDLLVAVVAPVLGCGGLVLDGAPIAVMAMSNGTGIEILTGADWIGDGPGLLLDLADDGRPRMVLGSGHDPDTAPMIVTAEGAHRSSGALSLSFPSTMATLVVADGAVEVGLPMAVSAGRGRVLEELDGVSAHQVLLDLLQTDDQFGDGPSVELPRLGVRPWYREGPAASGALDGRPPPINEVVQVDHERGSIELRHPVEVGPPLQIVRHDPSHAVAMAVNRLRLRAGRRHSAVVLTSDLPVVHLHELAARAYAALPRSSITGAFRPGGRLAGDHPWPAVQALVVTVVDDEP